MPLKVQNGLDIRHRAASRQQVALAKRAAAILQAWGQAFRCQTAAGEGELWRGFNQAVRQSSMEVQD